MSTEQIIAQILSSHPEITKKELMEKLESETERTGGLVSKETLLRLIAAQLGAKIDATSTSSAISTRDLIPGLDDATVTGRVLAVFPPRIFDKDGEKKIASIIIADKKGIMRVVLWNGKTSVLESGAVKAGYVVRISHAYTKEDRSGNVELHLGDRSEIHVDPQEPDTTEYPKIGTFITRIGDLAKRYRERRVNVTGIIRDALQPTTFERKDSSVGNVMRLELSDETGHIPIVVWNEKVDELEKTAKKGSRLRLVNAKVKKTSSGEVEVHVDLDTHAEIVDSTEEFLKIGNLKEGLAQINIEGEIATKPVKRDVKTSRGDLVKLATFELKDETGTIQVSAWRQIADAVEYLSIGDRIVIKDAYVKKGFAEHLELSTRSSTSISKIASPNSS